MDFFKSLIMGFLKPLTKQEQLEKHLLDLICSGYEPKSGFWGVNMKKLNELLFHFGYEPLTYYSSVLDRCYMPAREFERAKRILKEISKG
ncbi:hypothetical protein [Campylobacter sp. RM16191]|uniref:hypothetical protein n=1 Tax=Campylobacter sp. RM16191 TaxID=1705728 RepID=UPI0014739A5D|nr:hypothetical protein [Campylobacter sp. RM16191]